MSNTEIWDKISRPESKALKPFQRSGGFKGTAINPMYTLHTVTDVFGPCGKGWGMTKPDFQIVNNNVYCTVGVWYADAKEPVWGVGGEAITGRGDDEAFKKAYTDALGNALKHLGANADIYFNLWDGNKYVDETPAPAEPLQEKKTQLLTREEARALYKGLAKELVTLGTAREVADWQATRALDIKKLGDWKEYIDAEIKKHLAFIRTQSLEAAE